MSIDVERDRKALELRKAGASVERIASTLEYKSGEDALAGIHRALELSPADSPLDVIDLELERLDAMQRALWAGVLKGEPAAIDRCLSIMERRARLLGLDGQREPEEKEDRIDDLANRRARRLAARPAETSSVPGT